MARTFRPRVLWSLVIAAVLFILAMVVGGFFVWGWAILALLLVMGASALLYAKAGPPER